MNRTGFLIALFGCLVFGGTLQAQQPNFSGVYVNSNRAELQLNRDGSLTIRSTNGKVSPGRFTVNGDAMTLIDSRGNSYPLTIRGDNFYRDGGLVWIWRGAPTPAAPVVAPTPAAPVVAPLKLPSTYVSAQSSMDKLQLNADSSFSLQEGGQPYHGTFVLSNNTIELNIRENSSKTTLSRQGDNLTDSSGQTWSYREQSAGTAPATTELHNEDIIRLASVGIDDATIIAKIKGSRCQFDTSTDALIQLKKSGVRPAVIKAMMGAVQ